MSNKPPRCDSCNRRIRRRSQHELVLRDQETGQVIGRYHVRPACQEAAWRYLADGAALRGTFYHPIRCGDTLESCDGGLSEWAA